MSYAMANKHMDTSCMPPPRKVMRRGSQELEQAVVVGAVNLSLPKQDWTSWLSFGWEGSPQATRENISKISDSQYMQVSPGETERPAHHSSPHKANLATNVQRDPSPIPENDPQSIANENTHPVHEDPLVLEEASSNSHLPRFCDIIGHEEVKIRLDEVLLPLGLPRRLADSILTGVRSMPTTILLFGPPGCGKTELAKAVAGEAQAAFLSVGPSDILSKYVGESEASIRGLFDKAREQACLVESKCAVVFFDEIDALGQSRGGAGIQSSNGRRSSCSVGDPSSRRVLAELLVQLNRNNHPHGMNETVDSCTSTSTKETPEEADYRNNGDCGFSRKEPNVRVVIVAATNRPEDCDPALLRRFNLQMLVDLPTRRDRGEILRRYLKGIDHILSKEQLDNISSKTAGWSGSDLENLTREAAMTPVRECIRSAARLKRSSLRSFRQPGGDSTCQFQAHNGLSAAEKTHRKLIDHFKNLRSVSILDFESALQFIGYNQNREFESTHEYTDESKANRSNSEGEDKSELHRAI